LEITHSRLRERDSKKRVFVYNACIYTHCGMGYSCQVRVFYCSYFLFTSKVSRATSIYFLNVRILLSMDRHTRFSSAHHSILLT